MASSSLMRCGARLRDVGRGGRVREVDDVRMFSWKECLGFCVGFQHVMPRCLHLFRRWSHAFTWAIRVQVYAGVVRISSIGVTAMCHMSVGLSHGGTWAHVVQIPALWRGQVGGGSYASNVLSHAFTWAHVGAAPFRCGTYRQVVGHIHFRRSFHIL